MVLLKNVDDVDYYSNQRTNSLNIILDLEEKSLSFLSRCISDHIGEESAVTAMSDDIFNSTYSNLKYLQSFMNNS